MNNQKISEALQKIRPNAQWVLTGHSMSGLDWLDKEQIKPNEYEIEQAIATIEIEKLQEAAAKATARQAVYDKLGLTADDVAALFE